MQNSTCVYNGMEQLSKITTLLGFAPSNGIRCETRYFRKPGNHEDPYAVGISKTLVRFFETYLHHAVT